MKIYGPVPSWRLGNSLGVDVVEVSKDYNKICSYNCFYCQLGHKLKRIKKPIKIKILENEIDTIKKKVKETNPDYITFSGQGEPTINLNLKIIAKKIKEFTNIPLAILTNSSFIELNEVRQGIEICDLALLKIDSYNQGSFEKINSPNKKIKLKNIISGIKKLKTNVGIQTLLFSSENLTNANEKSINGLTKIYKEINKEKPIKIYLGTAYRPSDTKKIKPINEKRLQKIAKFIKNNTGIEVIYYKKSNSKIVKRNLNKKELKIEILKLLERRPCTQKEISTRFGRTNVSEILDSLIQKGLIKKRYQLNEIFYFKYRGV
jgi:wyosine [tRNA(Phe)-imidazoG37] synthetase (radical SAM superfamily)